MELCKCIFSAELTLLIFLIPFIIIIIHLSIAPFMIYDHHKGALQPNRGASSGIRGGNSSLRKGDIPNTTA